NVIALPASAAEQAAAQGLRPEAAEEKYARVAKERRTEGMDSLGGKMAAGVFGLARGATLGLSDVALGAVGGKEALSAVQEANPLTSSVSQLVGSLAPIGPAGELTGIGEKIIKAGEGTGALAKAGYSAGGGALIGAGQGGGAYISQVALDDKPLSAE